MCSHEQLVVKVQHYGKKQNVLYSTVLYLSKKLYEKLVLYNSSVAGTSVSLGGTRWMGLTGIGVLGVLGGQCVTGVGFIAAVVH